MNTTMIDAVKLGLGKLMAPPPPLKPYVPTPEKVAALVDHLADDRLYVSDEFRNKDALWRAVTDMFAGDKTNLIYEVGADAGMLAFTDILVGWKCGMCFKLWDRAAWGPGLARAGKKIVADVMDVCRLVRIETTTPDATMARLGKLCGLHEEGVKEMSFRWGGEYFDEIILAATRPKEGE